MTTITALPPAPSRATDSREQFQSKADALLSQLVNATVSEMNAVAGETNAAKVAAEIAEGNAEAFAAIKNTDKYKGAWSAATAYAAGDSVRYDGEFWLANAASTNQTPVEGVYWSRVYRLVASPGTINAPQPLYAMGAYTITAGGTYQLPADAAVGEIVGVRKTCDAAVYVGRNGMNIEGKARDIPLVAKSRWLWLMYVGGAEGWIDANDGELFMGTGSPQFMDVNKILTLTAIPAGAGATCTAIQLDADRTLILMGGDKNVHGVIYNESTGLFGTPVLIRTGDHRNNLLLRAVKTAADQVFVAMAVYNSANIAALVLTISGSAITVGAAATSTMPGGGVWTGNTDGIIDLIKLSNGSLVLSACATSTALAGYWYAASISGTTVTLSASPMTPAISNVSNLFDMGNGVALAMTAASSTTLYATPLTVTGSTITAGTSTNMPMTEQNPALAQLASGRVLALGVDTGAAKTKVGLFSVAGTVASVSAANMHSGGASSGYGLKVIGNQAICYCGTGHVNVATDNAGTLSMGAEIYLGSGIVRPPLGYSATELFVNAHVGASNDNGMVAVGISGNNPVVNYRDVMRFTASGSAPGSWQSGKLTAGSQVLCNPMGWSGLVAPGTAVESAFITNGRSLRRIVLEAGAAGPYNGNAAAQARGRDDSEVWGWYSAYNTAAAQVSIYRVRII
ncbi:MAG: hypothetical protein ACYC0T_21355 [Ramlibacter sp.]